jgi:hypothetical protein
MTGNEDDTYEALLRIPVTDLEERHSWVAYTIKRCVWQISTSKAELYFLNGRKKIWSALSFGLLGKRIDERISNHDMKILRVRQMLEELKVAADVAFNNTGWTAESYIKAAADFDDERFEQIENLHWTDVAIRLGLFLGFNILVCFSAWTVITSAGIWGWAILILYDFLFGVAGGFSMKFWSEKESIVNRNPY